MLDDVHFIDRHSLLIIIQIYTVIFLGCTFWKIKLSRKHHEMKLGIVLGMMFQFAELAQGFKLMCANKFQIAYQHIKILKTSLVFHDPVKNVIMAKKRVRIILPFFLLVAFTNELFLALWFLLVLVLWEWIIFIFCTNVMMVLRLFTSLEGLLLLL